MDPYDLPAKVGDVVSSTGDEGDVNGVVLGYEISVVMVVDFDGEIRKVPLLNGKLPDGYHVRLGPPDDPDDPLSVPQEIELAAAKVAHPTARDDLAALAADDPDA